MKSGRNRNGKKTTGEMEDEVRSPTFRVQYKVAQMKTRGPRSKKLKQQIARLSAPKLEYVPKDPFKYSDFRGLLNADYQTALSHRFKQEDLQRINVELRNPGSPTQGSIDLMENVTNSLEQAENDFQARKLIKP